MNNGIPTDLYPKKISNVDERLPPINFGKKNKQSTKYERSERLVNMNASLNIPK